MKNLRKLAAIGATILLCAGATQAQVVETDSWAPDGEGNRSYNLNGGGFTTTTFTMGDDGLLDSFAFYLLDDPSSPLPDAGQGDIALSLYSGSAGFTGSAFISDLDDIGVAEVAASETVTSEFDFSFFEVIVDLSVLGLDVMTDEVYSIVMTVENGGGYSLVGTGRTTGTNYGTNPGSAPIVNRTFSTSGPGGSGSVSFSNSFAVFVDITPDDGGDPVDTSPVPLPAGLPLALVGLGALGLIRRFR